ncbi:MAG: DNA polymerase III subunit epsilon [Pseudomonadota bacterium]
MRQVVLDTETTGLATSEGHRIIEIGAIELVNRRATGRRYHRFLDPERDIDEGAERVHGISLQDLDGQPKFAEIADEFLKFIRGAELVIHNADFDVGFLEHELTLMVHPEPDLRRHASVVDTLALARTMHPGQRNSLDALCKRYDVDASGRDLHGALIDADLLARVYLAMTGGQVTLSLDAVAGQAATTAERIEPSVRPEGLTLVVTRASADELAAHEAMLDTIAGRGLCIWRGESSNAVAN